MDNTSPTEAQVNELMDMVEKYNDLTVPIVVSQLRYKYITNPQSQWIPTGLAKGPLKMVTNMFSSGLTQTELDGLRGLKLTMSNSMDSLYSTITNIDPRYDHTPDNLRILIDDIKMRMTDMYDATGVFLQETHKLLKEHKVD